MRTVSTVRGGSVHLRGKALNFQLPLTQQYHGNNDQSTVREEAKRTPGAPVAFLTLPAHDGGTYPG